MAFSAIPSIQSGVYSKRKQYPYVSDIISAEASTLPSLKALKIQQEQEQEQANIEKESIAASREAIASSERVATVGRESSEALAKRKEEIDREIANKKNEWEDIFSKRNISQTEELAARAEEIEGKKAAISNILGVGQLGVAGVTAAKGLYPSWDPSSSTTGAGVGAFSGGAAGYYLTKDKKPKYQLAGTVGGAIVGGILGYYAGGGGGGFGGIMSSIGYGKG